MTTGTEDFKRDCPNELKASNGELHTIRCKVCGDGWRKSVDVCIAQPVQLAPAAQVPMTEDQIIKLVIKCEKDWNKCAAESNQWKDLYWEEYAATTHARLRNQSPL